MSLEGAHIGRFRLLGLLGRGGMGEVYLAEDEQLRRQVAIKVIQAEYPDPDATRLFLREARAIAMLNHSHILPLFDFGEATIHGTTLTYMVMPFCQEGTLAAWMQQHRTTALPSLQDVGFIIQQAAGALQYAHNHQIVHQDVKPSNFLIRSSEDAPGRPDLLLADFGVAKSIGTSASVSQAVRGTATYMAPEQWEGRPVPATDQYALAILAYDLLTGHPPFQGGLGQVMYQHLQLTPQPPSKLNPRLPIDVDTVLLHALAKKPEERFASISAFARAFQQALPVDSSIPTKANTLPEPDSSATRATLAISEAEALAPSSRTTLSTETRNHRRGLTAILLVGLALLVAVGSSIGVFSFIRSKQQNPPSPTTTSTPQQNPYPPYTTLALDDPMSDNSYGYSWDEGSDSLGTCAFTAGAYHVNAIQPNKGKGCVAGSDSPPSTFSDFAYEVQMTIIKGDGGGILIRDDKKGNGYYFFITQDGNYGFATYNNCPGNNCNVTLLRNTSNLSAIHTGLNQSNLVAVVAQGSTIELYVNNQGIDSVSDSNYSQGHIGVAASDMNNPTEVVFSNTKVWT